MSSRLLRLELEQHTKWSVVPSPASGRQPPRPALVAGFRAAYACGSGCTLASATSAPRTGATAARTVRTALCSDDLKTTATQYSAFEKYVAVTKLNLMRKLKNC